MNKILLIGMPGGWEWIIILVVILLLFGGSRLPQLAKSLGQSKRAFKEGLDDADEEARLEKPRPSSASLSASTLASVDDDELIAEARRREQQRVAGQNKA
ncbi:MAG: twin-arginine translocase TatA/TatE family subunit [Acidobacteria bacterium]|nr:twin-arginine translocase TatA/TatE family subunit [Acidobacteriota bacterium]